MGERGRLKALAYDWEHVAGQVLDFYHKTLNESPRKIDFQREESVYFAPESAGDEITTQGKTDANVS